MRFPVFTPSETPLAPTELRTHHTMSPLQSLVAKR